MGRRGDRRAAARAAPAAIQEVAVRRAHLHTRIDRERLVVKLRGLALLFALGQSLVEAGDSLLLTWVVVGALAADWALTGQLLRRDPVRHHITAGWTGMGMDAVIVALALANTRQDAADPTFLIVLFLSLEAALRWGRWGGILGGVASGLLAAVWGWSIVTPTGHEPASYFTLRLFTIAIVGAITGDLVHRLNLERGRLAQMAYADPLTGLANRSALQEAVSLELASHRSPGLIYLDLDGFKAVNDRLGHSVGDVVLVTVADRMRALVRDGDVVARLGGDEFVIVVSGEARVRVDELARRLEAAVVAPIDVGERDVVVGVSWGHAVARGVDDVDSLVRRADDAMYAAKRAGRRATAG